MDRNWPWLRLETGGIGFCRTDYVDDGHVVIDNNHCENLVRPVALGRKNWLFAGSLRAGQRAAAVMSLIQSAVLNGLDGCLPHGVRAFRDGCLTMSYFHGRGPTIIGAKAFHVPVRDGQAWFHFAMVVRQSLLAASLVCQAGCLVWQKSTSVSERDGGVHGFRRRCD